MNKLIYSRKLIKSQGKDIGDGYVETELVLGENDVAPGDSTKWMLRGPGTVTYTMHPSGDVIRPGEGITRAYPPYDRFEK
jgi:hypothetical protein